MIQDEVFIWKSGLLSHPVTYLFHLGETGASGSDLGALGAKRLVIADCRSISSSASADAVDAALGQKKPVLLLCPHTDTLEALQGHAPLIPQVPVAALLISPRAEGPTGVDVWSLQYSAVPVADGTVSAPSAAAEKEQAPQAAEAPIECACSDAMDLLGAFTSSEAVNTFKMAVEHAMEGRSSVTADPPPTGVVYFLDTFNSVVPFTYNHGVSNGAGSATFTWTVWGFLSQTASSNTQYLSVEGRISVNAGSLHSNDQCDRGFGNAYVKGTLAPPSAMKAQAFVPVSGNGNFTGSVTIPISYKNPLGGYSIWNYTSSMNNSVDSWSCKSISSGANLGAQWWMNKPCDGSNVPDKWKDAFSTWGHVGDLTGASSGSLDVNSISAWFTQQMLNGYQVVTGNFGWEGARFWGSSCSPGMYWKINASWQWWYNVSPGFTVNFSRIYPS